MRFTRCDNCGRECVNTTVHVSVSIEQTTNHGEVIGYNDYRKKELCKECGGGLPEQLSMEIREHTFLTMEVPPAQFHP